MSAASPDPRSPLRARAAQFLLDGHRDRKSFVPLPAELLPSSVADAYAMQDVFTALKAKQLDTTIAGYKIALTTPTMRKFTGFNDSIGGTLLAAQVLQSPARVTARDYGRLIIESEIAFEMGDDADIRAKPYDRESIAPLVAAVMPAFEIADDRAANYDHLAANILSLIVDNAWNEGAVLGAPIRDWRHIDLAAVRGAVSINGKPSGEGFGRDVLGHPLEALAWIANRLIERGRALLRGQVVITGSLVVSKFLQPGDTVSFAVDALGSVELLVE